MNASLTSALAAAFACTSALAAQSFTIINPLPSANVSTGRNVSGDGLTAIGRSGGIPSAIPFHWTSGAGTQGLPILPDEDNVSARGVSFDGSVIAGTSEVASGPGVRAWLWTQSAGTVSLPALSGSTNLNRSAFAVSANGQITVGQARTSANAFRAVYWNGSSNPIDIAAGQASSVSTDGSVIAGSNGSTCFRWTQDTGAFDLPFLPSTSQAAAGAMSADGSVIAGNYRRSLQPRVFRWTQATGTVEIPVLPGWDTIDVTGMSADGSVMVGNLNPSATTSQTSQAFYWTQATGMVTLRSVLYPAVPDNWQLIQVNGISADGLTVVGTARDENGSSPDRAYIATIPEPAIGAFALFSLAAIRRRRS